MTAAATGPGRWHRVCCWLPCCVLVFGGCEPPATEANAPVARETLLGTHGKNPWGRNESIDVMDALKSYTRWAARQVFLENKIGSVESGKYADLVVWDRDPLSIPTEDLKEMTASLTLMNGEVVHGDLESTLWQ